MKYLLGLFCFLFMLTTIGCSKKTVPPQVVTHTVDSVTIDRYIVVRDTVLIADSASVIASISSQDFNDLISGKKDTIQKKSKQASLNLYKDRRTGLVNADCNCDTMSILAKLKDTYERASQKTSTTNTVIQKVKYTPPLVNTLAWVGGLTIGYVVLRLVLKRVV